MFQKLFYTSFCIYIFQPILIVHGSYLTRQKLLLSISQELLIKNIVLIGQPSYFNDAEIMTFAKRVFQSNIYFSFLSPQQVELTIDEKYGDQSMFFKTVIATLEEKFNDKIYDLIQNNEMEAWRFLWLIWKSKNQTIAKDKSPYVPYNCQLLIVEEKNISTISEIYYPSIFSSKIFTRDFGTWSENNGIQIPEKDIYARRLNMDRTQFKVIYNWDDPPADEWLLSLSIIVGAMNFRSVPTFINNSFEESEKYDELKEASDLNLRNYGYYSLIEEDDPIIGMMWKSPHYMNIRFDQFLENYGINSYVNPFSKKLWFALFSFILATGAFTLIIAYKSSSGFSLLSAVYHPFEALTNQDGSETSNSKSIRITILTARFVALFLVPAYSAFLLTYILTPKITPPFTDIKGLIQDGSYKIVTHNANMFKYSNDIWYKTAYEKYLIPSNELPNILGILKEICNSKKLVYIVNLDIEKLTFCKVIKIPTLISNTWNGMNLNSRSPYQRIFNRMLKSCMSAGILVKVKNDDYFLRLRLKNPYNSQEDLPKVKLQNIAAILQITACLYTSTIAILVLECLYKRFRRAFRKNNFKNFAWES